MNKKPKILLLDIENSPNLSYTWGKYEQDVIGFEREWHMLSFAYKWLGESTVKAMALPDFSGYKKNKTDDLRLLEHLHELLDEADIVIGHNVDRFDVRKTNARLLFHGMRAPSGYQTIDTLKVARKYFFLNSNKLGDLATYLGLDGKVDTGGFKLWLQCMAGDKAAWRKMVKYNKQDVKLLEEVYLRLRPWMNSHPNLALISNRPTACPSCMAEGSLQARGKRVTKTRKYQRYQCLECGSWTSGTEATDKIALK